MTRAALDLKLTEINQPSVARVQVSAKGNEWTSSDGQWLPFQRGTWLQKPDGLYLMDSAKKKQAAICQGCFFTLSGSGDIGRCLFPEIAGAGDWKVVKTSP